MRIGLYGGSFDPIHYGHLKPVRAALENLALDRVDYLPTARPPHKPRREGASALARFTMVELALLEEGGLYASSFELEDRVTYTIETLEQYHLDYPDAQLVLIVGRDSFVQLDTWRDWRRILQLAEIAVLERPSDETTEPSAQLSEALAEVRVHRIANRPIDVSSTEVRRRIASQSENLHQLVPPLVLNYIEKYDLYR